MAGILRKSDLGPVFQVATRHGGSERSISTWRQRHCGMPADDVKTFHQLVQKNAMLMKLPAERDLEIEIPAEIAAKQW